MRIETLPSPGLLSNGVRLRVEAAKAISSAEVTAGRSGGGKTIAASTLADFFTACAAALASIKDATVPALSAATALVTATTTIKISFAEAMDTSVTPSYTAFTISGDTVTGAAWGTAGDAGKLILTGTGFAAAETLAYTKPATNFLRDLAGNAMATGTVVLS